MRSIVFKLEDVSRLDSLTAQQKFAGDEWALELPDGEDISNGEWVLAIFELGEGRRSTAAAGRCQTTPDGPVLLFEARDIGRISSFLEAGRHLHQADQADQAEPPISSSRSPGRLFSLASPDLPPMPPSSIRLPISGPSRASIASWAGSLVLLVDDDPDIREVVGAMLEAVGLRVEACASAEQALELAAEQTFDLLVLDWGLPGMNGLELCRTLRSAADTASMPVLFLSANASSQDMLEAFACGADDYVVKPFRAPELGARIFGLLRRSNPVGHPPPST